MAEMPILFLMESSLKTDMIDELSIADILADDSEVTSGEARVNRISRAVLLAVIVAIVLAAFAGAGLDGLADGGTAGPDAESSARLGGDFAAFYAAGSIVWEGDIDSLYDPVRQEQAQSELGIDGYLGFAYPPHVAAAYAPLGALGFQTAYLVHTLLMIAAFVIAMVMLSDVVPLLHKWRWPLLAASLTFYPLATAIGGGQNAALSVLCVAAIWRGLHDGREDHAGIAAGLLLFRPQYALPIIGLMLLSRHGGAVIWAFATATVTWAGTALVLGVNWLSTWWAEVVPFVEQDAEVNAANSISILGFLQAASSTGGRPVVIAGAAGAAVVVLVLVFLWSNPDRFSLANRMGAVAIGMTLVSPHTMFYDASLILIAGAAVLASRTIDQPPIALFGLIWAASLVHLASGGLGATPLAPVILLLFGAMVWHTLRVSPGKIDLAVEGFC
ncbi:MAG: hypothetical protein ACI81L_000521 [Verrucomicrobiales bacterium]|jgi:hypothetical protein